MNLPFLKFKRFYFFKITLLMFMTVFLFLGCEKTKSDGLQKVHWDRDMCEQCKMVVSIRNYAVQVVNPNSGKSYMFDDLGCTVLWFKDEKIEWEKDAKIYITDAVTGEFFDARKAFYDTDSQTPMDYGFGAYKDKNSIDPSKKVIDYEEAKLRILRGETMQNLKIRQGL